MKKNYNYTRCKLFLPEYGRHIHEMVASLLEIEDRRERTRQAKAVIAVMGNLNRLFLVVCFGLGEPAVARYGRLHAQIVGSPLYHV